jgi:hypothetical protein
MPGSWILVASDSFVSIYGANFIPLSYDDGDIMNGLTSHRYGRHECQARKQTGLHQRDHFLRSTPTQHVRGAEAHLNTVV